MCHIPFSPGESRNWILTHNVGSRAVGGVVERAVLFANEGVGGDFGAHADQSALAGAAGHGRRTARGQIVALGWRLGAPRPRDRLRTHQPRDRRLGIDVDQTGRHVASGRIRRWVAGVSLVVDDVTEGHVNSDGVGLLRATRLGGGVLGQFAPAALPLRRWLGHGVEHPEAVAGRRAALAAEHGAALQFDGHLLVGGEQFEGFFAPAESFHQLYILSNKCLYNTHTNMYTYL